MSSINRRQFVRTAVKGGALIAPSLSGLIACAERMAKDPTGTAWPSVGSEDVFSAGYGNLIPAGPELALPAGFQYVTLGAEGAPMSDGYLTPGYHDGMGAFSLPNGRTLLIRNHEDKQSASALGGPIGPAATAYDLNAGGGTTSIEIAYPGGVPTIVRQFISMNGTSHNCAGGPTPWGTWLSGEETTQGQTQGRYKPHGYMYEVSKAARGPVMPVPLKAMGRFSHEAAAVDPATGYVYMTEDTDMGGFYRFIPNQRGNLAAGGVLQMLRLTSTPQADMRQGQPLRVGLGVSWVTIANPDPAAAETNPNAVFNQGYGLGGALFTRLEGCWYGDKRIYFCSKFGGAKRLGQVWMYLPRFQKLALIYESTDSNALDGPGNLTVSPRGGLAICEDGNGGNFIQGIDTRGQIFPFAQNLINEREFAGACYSPDGQYLFVNIQGNFDLGILVPSYTFAIWGPWGTGKL